MDLNIVYQLDWSPLNAPDSAKGKKAVASALSAERKRSPINGVVIAQDFATIGVERKTRSLVVTVQTDAVNKKGSKAKKRKGQRVSAAAVFAHAVRQFNVRNDAVYIGLTGVADKYSVIVVSDGLVLRGWDRVVDAKWLSRELSTQLMTALPDANITFFGHFDGTVETDDVGAPLSVNDNPLDLLALCLRSDLPNDTFIKKVAAPFPVIPAALVLALAAGGFFGYQHYKKKEAAKLAAAQVKQIDPNVLYERELKTAVTSVKLLTSQDFLALVAKVESFPLFVGGFRLGSEISCDLMTLACGASYARLESATYEQFRDDAKGRFDTVVYKESGDSVGVSMMLPAPSGAQFVVNDLPKSSDLTVSFFSPLQSVREQGVSATLAPLTAFAVPAGVDVAQLKQVVERSAITLSGPMYAIRELALVSPSVSYKKMTVQVGDDKAVLKLDGDLYAVRK